MSNNHQRIEAVAPGSSEKGRVSSASDSSDDRKRSAGGGSSSEGGTNSEPNLNPKGYRDFSKLPPALKEKAETTPSNSQPAKDPTFPVKLHMILSNPQYEDIISWLPHGRAWRITEVKNFEEKIIPLYFRHGRYSSFARQVNGWGFHRVMQGSDYNSYYHELFLRGLPHLCERMRRLTPKDIASRKTSECIAPDFYALSRDHPLPEGAVCPPSHPILQPPAIAAAAQAGQSDSYGPILAELEMLEKRRREIVDRIAVLAKTQDLGGTSVHLPVAPDASHRGSTDSNKNQAGLSNSNASGVDAIRSILGHQGNSGDASSKPQPVVGGGDSISSILQQAGLIALSQQPGGAHLVAQILQANNQNTNKPSAPVPTPDATAQNALLMMPGGLQMLQHLMNANQNNQASQPAPVVQAPAPAAPSNAQMLEMLIRSIGAPNLQASIPSAVAQSSLTLSARAPIHQGINNAAVATTQQNALIQMLMQAQQQQQQAQAVGLVAQANNSSNAVSGSPQNAQLQQANDDDDSSNSDSSSPKEQNNLQQTQMPQVNNSSAVGHQQQQQQNAQQNAFLQLQQQMSGGNNAQQAALLQMLQAAAQQQNAPHSLLQSGNLASFLAMSNNNNNNPSGNNNGKDQNKGPGTN